MAVFKLTCTEADVAKKSVIFIENRLMETKLQVEKRTKDSVPGGGGSEDAVVG